MDCPVNDAPDTGEPAIDIPAVQEPDTGEPVTETAGIQYQVEPQEPITRSEWPFHEIVKPPAVPNIN